MKTYLISGGAGFIGSAYLKYILKKYLEQESIKVIVVDILTYAGNLGNIREELKDKRVIFERVDIRNKIEILRIFSENDIDFVVNFAAESHVDRSIENPYIFFETNVLGTQILLEAAKKSWTISKDENNYPIYREGVKFLQISTDEVYGSLVKDYDEAKDFKIGKKIFKTYGKKFFTEKSSLKPSSPYSSSKASADLLAMAYWETYKFPINITRCSNNYGEHQFPEKLIPLTIKNILTGKKISIYGKGENVRDWLYVEDHCVAIDTVLRRAKLGEIYNISAFNERKNIEMAKLLIDITKEEILKIKKKNKQEADISSINYDLITFVKDRLGHDMRYAVDA